MSTETFHPDRLILSMESSTAVYRDDLQSVFDGLTCVDERKAEDLVAVAGEDERAYRLKPRSGFLDRFCKRADEFLDDDEGGFYKMLIHLTRHERSDAIVEVWFHVGTPGISTGGTWFRHMVVGIDDAHVYANI